MVRLVLNVIWLVLSGFWLALCYTVAGVVMLIPIVTIPFSIAAFRLAGFVLWPFGRTVVRKPSAGTGSAIGNVLWFVLAGIWIAVGHVATSIALAATIIGIPLAWANLKLAVVALAPLGKEIVDRRDPRATSVW
ncbi:MAG TPA: YccF domain-containing protein [Kineosporiaceae bacterium]|nr:YccF domain-containing protein [Kineosporiaceae bacterium]